MTPKKAKELLEQNINNRPINKTYVNYLVEQIKNKNFIRVGDCISIDKYGELLNGQHRLYAIVLAGIPVKVDIKYGTDPKAKYYQNTGRPTTLNDKGSIFLSDYNLKPFMYSPICRTMEFFKNGGKYTTKKMNFNAMEVKNFIEKNNLLSILQKISNKRKKGKSIFGNQALALSKEIIFNLIDENKSDYLFDKIYESDITKGTLEHKLYTWLLERKNSNKNNSKWGKGGEDMLDNAINKTWKALLTNKNITRMSSIEIPVYDPQNKLASFYVK